MEPESSLPNPQEPPLDPLDVQYKCHYMNTLSLESFRLAKADFTYI
jgi:hypothetical protein